jgi:hypothetical protein
MNAPSHRRVRHCSRFDQTDLFAAPAGLPEGFRYHPGVLLLSVEEEEALARELASLPFKPFDFHGYLANRQVVSFAIVTTTTVARSLRPRRFHRFSNRYASRSLQFSTARRTLSGKFSSKNTGPAQELAGIETRRSSMRSSACRCLRLAGCASAGSRARLGIARRSWSSHAPLMCSRGQLALCGSTAFRPLTSFVI